MDEKMSNNFSRDDKKMDEKFGKSLIPGHFTPLTLSSLS